MDFGEILNPANLGKKYGPLPLYGWVGIAVVVVGGGYYLYRKFHPATAAASSVSGLQCPPGYQADPTGQYCVPSGTSVSPSASGSSGGGGTATVDTSGLQSLLSQFQANLATSLGGLSGASVGAGSGTGAGAPVVNANPPGTVTPNNPTPASNVPSGYPATVTLPSGEVVSNAPPVGQGQAALTAWFLKQINPVTGLPNSAYGTVDPVTGLIDYITPTAQPVSVPAASGPLLSFAPLTPAPAPSTIVPAGAVAPIVGTLPGVGSVPMNVNLMPQVAPPLLLPAPGPAYGPQNQPAYYVGSNGLNYAPVQAPGSTVIGPPSAPGPFANPQNVLTVLGPGG